MPRGFDVYIGLDQTGAVNRRGEPKPFPAAVLFRGWAGRWRLETGLRLSHFREEAVRDLLRVVTGARGARTLLAVDVAIGAAEFVVAEAYPSFVWREIFGERHRSAVALARHLKKLFPAQPELRRALGADHADAAALAVGARELVEKRAALEAKFPAFVRRREGWILGL